MSKFTKILIKLYSQNSIDELKEDQEYIKLVEANTGDRIFDYERMLIEDLKSELEVSVNIQTSIKDQVIEALYYSSQIIDPKDIHRAAVYYELVTNIYDQDWTTKEMEHFKFYHNALQSYDDYFLSFTNRKIDAKKNNAINRNYKFLIKSIITGDDYNKANQKDNLLAKAINNLLKERGLNGFFYPEKEGDSKDVETKLMEGCKNSFVFIQIVQNIMFKKKDAYNYCHFEYKHVTTKVKVKKDIKYVLAENSIGDLIEKKDVFFEYNLWYKDVFDKDKLTLENTPVKNQEVVQIQRDNIREKLVKEIDRLKWEIIENVPT